MATFKEVIFEHHKTKNDTYNVKVRVSHKGQSKYIDTDYYVVRQQLNKKLELKDPLLQNRLNEILKDYRDEVVAMGDRINYFDAQQLKLHLIKKFKSVDLERVDFIAFCRGQIKELKKLKQTKNANNFNTVANALEDFFDKKEIYIDEINYNFLLAFEKYLRSERKITRFNQFDKPVTTVKKGLGDSGVHHYMRDLRTLFNNAISHFNDEDAGLSIIKHYPFKKYKIGSPPKTTKRNLSPDLINKIFDFDDFKPASRMELAKDVAFLSFCLIGMNTADLFQVNEYENGRIGYKRAKTKGRRDDEAFISIKVEPEITNLIEKYKDQSGNRIFNFHKRYADEDGFYKAINTGLKQISEILELTVKPTTYYFRHSWATIARNNCRISKDDISLALNHVDQDNKTTDIYLEKDWTIIDEANRKVIDYINSLKK